MGKYTTREIYLLVQRIRNEAEYLVKFYDKVSDYTESLQVELGKIQKEIINND